MAGSGNDLPGTFRGLRMACPWEHGYGDIPSHGLVPRDADGCRDPPCQRQWVDRTTPPMMNAKPMSKFQFPIALITGMLPLVM